MNNQSMCCELFLLKCLKTQKRRPGDSEVSFLSRVLYCCLC